MYKSLICLATGLALTFTASAQVFVIGDGLGAECYEKTRQAYHSFRQAEEICTRALREQTMSRTNRAATFVNRGVLRMRHGDYEQADMDYQKAIELQDDLGAAYLNRGASLIYQKQFADALPVLNRAIELGSSDLHAAYYNRAIVRENTNDTLGAYQDFQKALALKPGWELAQQQLDRFSVAGNQN